MTVKEYEEIYNSIVSLSVDADAFGLFDEISDEDIEKAKWIYAIMDCLDDVPAGRVEHIAQFKGIDFEKEVESIYEN